jgi:DNA-binding SARP family transcriptional activator/tetratricopeptide (TPR) repeat protein
VQFRLLGPVELIAGEREIGLPKPRSRAVLAFLLLSANRSVTTDSLVDALWGPTPPATARNQIQADVSALRRTLRQSGLRDPIRTTAHGYQIGLHANELDLLVFEDLRRSALALSEKDELVPAAESLHEAIDLWRGQPLGDVSGAFVEAARVALTEQYLRAAEDLADLELRAGRHRAVIPLLTTLARQHPLREGLIRPLALALYRDGQTPEALAVLRALRAGLVRELGIDMPAGLAELEVAILRGEAGVEPRPPMRAGPDAVQVTAPVASQVNALPAAVVGFTGRQGELNQLDALAVGGKALVTVTGSAGIGKTALVLHWAHQAAQRFPDGLLYVDLCGFSHQPPLLAIEALSRLLHQLGVAPAQIPTREDFAADLYRTRLAGKRALVVLDNARDSDQVRALLPGEPGCAAVVTSRIELSGLVAREGAVPIRLDVLSPQEARRLLGALLGPNDRPEVDELARICAFVPLALRIAAASVLCRPQHGLRDHIARIRSADRLDALRLDGDDDTAMVTTLMHSYQLLSPEARRLFRLLSLVPGPDFTPAAAAGLAQLPAAEVAALLDRLAAAHLMSEREADRFGFHDLLRFFAQRQALAEDTQPQRDDAVQSLYEHYVARAGLAARRLYPQVLRLPDEDDLPGAEGFASDAAAIAWLDAERHNLVAAVVSGCDRGPRRQAWRLADSLRGYFFLKMFTVDWQSVANAALLAARAEGDRRAQAAALLSLADLQWRQGDHDLADAAYSEAMEHALAAGWSAGQATALGNLGGMRRMQGRLAEAASLIERSLALNVEIGRIEGQLVNLGNLGIIHGEIGNWGLSEDYLDRALALCRRIGSRTGEAVSLSNLVDTAIHLGKLDLARDRLDQALVLHRELGDNAAQASTLRSLALIHHHQGDLTSATEIAAQAVALAEEGGDHRVLAHCLQAHADLLRQAGADGEAGELAERAAKLAHEAGHRFVEARALLGLARVQRGRDRHQLGLAAARQALALAESCGYAELLAEAAREVELCGAPTAKPS